jgi:RNA polymerase sigma-70 factor (ECF subfamily)
MHRIESLPGSSPNGAPPAGSGISAADREALYRDFRPLVRSLIGRYGDDPELREELPGEIYARFCQLVADYEPGRGVPLKLYLVRTLSASVYSYARSRWQRRRRESSLELELGLNARVGSSDPAREWDEQIAMQRVLEQLPDAIVRLPLRQRQVVVWFYYEGLAFEEIAQTLEIQPATARSLLRHGIARLRQLILLAEDA